MADRADIARRHGIEHLAHKLVGDTAEALEADAAAKAALIQMFAPRRLDEEPAEPPEPAVEGLPPGDKKIVDYTAEESAAQHAALGRSMREKAKREAREQREQEERREAEANRTPEQAHADVVVESLRPGAKRARQVELLRSLGLGEEDHDG